MESSNWGSAVKKGTVLAMNMSVKKAALDDSEEGARRQGNIFPCCYNTVMPDERWF